jgi:DNA segregation ATPase FtsK/SpoIIIE-like protein
MVTRDPGLLPAGVLEHVAHYVIRNQVGTWNAIGRAARVGHSTQVVLVAALEDLGILGPAGPHAKREVLVPYTDLEKTLDKVRAYERGDLT